MLLQYCCWKPLQKFLSMILHDDNCQTLSHVTIISKAK